MVYLIAVLIRLIIAPFILIFFILEAITLAVMAILRWIFTGNGVNISIGSLKIGD